MTLRHLNDDEDPEIGYRIKKSESGKGLTTVAANTITEYGFNTLRLERIVIKAEPKNLPGNKVAEKAGHSLERTITEDEGGRMHPIHLWSKIRP